MNVVISTKAREIMNDAQTAKHVLAMLHTQAEASTSVNGFREEAIRDLLSNLSQSLIANQAVANHNDAALNALAEIVAEMNTVLRSRSETILENGNEINRLNNIVKTLEDEKAILSEKLAAAEAKLQATLVADADQATAVVAQGFSAELAAGDGTPDEAGVPLNQTQPVSVIDPTAGIKRGPVSEESKRRARATRSR